MTMFYISSTITKLSIRVQSTTFSKRKMVIALTSPVPCSQEYERKLMEDNKPLTMLNEDILSKSNEVPFGFLPAQYEECATSLQRYLFVPALQVVTNIRSFIKRGIRELKHFSDEKVQN